MTTLLLMYVILLAAVIVFAKQLDATSPTIAEKPVQFSLQNVQGEQVQLADYTGKIVIVNFWRRGVHLAEQRCRICSKFLWTMLKSDKM